MEPISWTVSVFAPNHRNLGLSKENTGLQCTLIGWGLRHQSDPIRDLEQVAQPGPWMLRCPEEVAWVLQSRERPTVQGWCCRPGARGIRGPVLQRRSYGLGAVEASGPAEKLR